MTDQAPEITPEGGSTLRHYAAVLWRRKWVFVVPLVVIPLVILVASARQQAVYEATADVLVNRQGAATTSLIGQTPAADDPGRSIDTQVRLARLPTVAERVLAATGDTATSVNAFLTRTSVYPLADILRFSVEDHDAATAVDLAGEYARQFVEYRRELDTAGLSESIAELASQITRLEDEGRNRSPLYVRLSDRLGQLQSLETLQSSNVLVVHAPALGDEEKVAPRPKRNAGLALVAGVIIGLLVVFLWESVSTRPQSTREIEAALGMPLLASLRVRGGPEATRYPSLLRDPGGQEADGFHRLRTSLALADSAGRLRTVMVTSSRAGEGKSTTAANLSIALARAGRRVVLVDLDLRKPALAEAFGLDAGGGVTAVLTGDVALESALSTIPLDDVPHGQEAGGRLEVLPAGAPPNRPAELLSSPAVEELFGALAKRGDLVLVDVPPLLDAPDAAALSCYVDALLLVVDSRRMRTPVLAESRRAIEAWDVARVGFVLTKTSSERQYLRSPSRARPATTAGVVSTERAT